MPPPSLFVAVLPAAGHLPSRRLQQRLFFLLMTLAVGLAGGTGAVLFRGLIGWSQAAAFGSGVETLVSVAAGLPAWRIMLAPVAGGLMVGLLIHWLMPERRPSGVADVIAAASVDGTRIGLRTAVAGALVNGISLGVGASLGREGPVVHLGAGLGEWLGIRLALPARQRRLLMGCGVAAAVAASFNAPAAAVVFAMEIVTRSHRVADFLSLGAAAAVGTLLGQSVYGSGPVFPVPVSDVPMAWEYPLFAGLGGLSAAVALGLIGSFLVWQRLFRRVRRVARIAPWLMPAVGGVLLGAMGVVVPEILGVGYEATENALLGAYPLGLLVGLLVAKLVALGISAGSGFGGGFFSPALYTGAMTGGAVALAVPALGGPAVGAYELYVLAGMGAVAGTVLGAPISTLVIVFELTASYQASLPVLLSVATALAGVRLVMGHSLFTLQLLDRGIDVTALPDEPALPPAARAP